jgi:hypothetical protein
MAAHLPVAGLDPIEINDIWTGPGRLVRFHVHPSRPEGRISVWQDDSPFGTYARGEMDWDIGTLEDATPEAPPAASRCKDNGDVDGPNRPL